MNVPCGRNDAEMMSSLGKYLDPQCVLLPISHHIFKSGLFSGTKQGNGDNSSVISLDSSLVLHWS